MRRRVAGETVALLEADPAVEVQILPLEVEETSLPSRDRQSGQRIVTVLAVASVCGWIVCAKNWQLGGIRIQRCADEIIAEHSPWPRRVSP